MAVLHHIGHAGRRAGIVLQHPERAGSIAHQVNAGDMRIHPAWRAEALHRLQVVLIALHQLRGNDAVAQDFAVIIDVAQKGVDGGHALLHAALDPIPVCLAENARDRIEGQYAVNAVAL